MVFIGTAVLLFAAVTSADILEFGELSLREDSNEINEETERVVGGREAEQGQFPWTVALFNEDQFICTASIISPTAILTAAHCVVFNGRLQRVSDFNGIIGDVDRSSSNVKQIIFKKITPHPYYDQLENDLAILETYEPIVFSDKIQPICIANKRIGRLTSKPVLAMGWGQTSRTDASNPDILHYVKQKVTSNLRCSILYLGRKVPDSTLCASGLLSGVCNGDSGGPLVYKRGNQNIQVGIASYVNALVGCGSVLGPAGFTRVSSFSDFIMSTATGEVCVA
ncbi:suppressor of tumorigenicity 14 protein [Nephila pilipes]|uniref:Suppressor of tumorigenicity 14 protein n=1 Tax=Nephila pilipes TaxID=299642 RepID=A0A8X6QUE0_NEPPI|nr:suppressor of tumorigenicity 14 protein [Nephila pilipes]